MLEVVHTGDGAEYLARAPKQSLPSKKCWPLHHGHEMPTRNHARAGGLPEVLTHPKTGDVPVQLVVKVSQESM